MSRQKKEVTDPVEPIVSREEFDRLIIDNINFVYKIVNDKFSNYPWHVKEELYSAGKRGLVVAATRFDPSKYSNKFISYAVSWIEYYVHEEIRILYPVKLNQNFVYKRNKINAAIKKYQDEYGCEPTTEEIAKETGLSNKVVTNILAINHGKDFSFVSFQTPTDSGDSESSDLVSNKLTNEYIEESTTAGMTEYEFKDLLQALKKRIPKLDYNVFIDKYVNNMSFSDIARKYNLPFASSVTYLIKKSEKVCKELLE